MAKEFEGEVRPVNTGPKQPKSDPDKDPTLEGADQDPQPDDDREDSPLKTVGGTPIIERQDG